MMDTNRIGKWAIPGIVAVFLATCVDATAQDFWQITNGPYGGSISALFVEGNGYLFAGLGNATIYRSRDNSESWQAFSTSLGPVNDAVRCFTSNAQGHLFAGLADLSPVPQFQRGARIVRSTDHGETWQTVYGGERSNRSIRSLVSTANGYIFAGGDLGILRSVDNGATWAVVSNLSRGVLAVDAQDHLWVGTDRTGLYLSTDNGINWTSVGFAGRTINTLAVHPNGHVYVAVDSNLFSSTDNGATWKLRDQGLPKAPMNSLAIKADGHLFAGFGPDFEGLGIFRSSDEGENWSAANAGLVNISVRVLAVHPQGYIFAGTYYGGVYRSVDNGALWTPASEGLARVYAEVLAASPAGRELFAGTSGVGVFRYQENGSQWQSSSYGLTRPNVRSLAINQNGEIFAGTYPGSIYRSQDHGANWILVNDLSSIGAVRSLAVNAAGHIFAGTHFGGAIFRSTDNGNTWRQVYFGAENCAILSLVINREGYIFAGVDGLCGVLRSTDNGEHWEQAHGGLPNYAVSTLALNSKGELFAGGSFTGVYHLRSNGDDSWVRIDTTLKFGVNAYTMVVGVTDQIFMGTYSSGAFRSRDHGVTWTALPDGFSNAPVHALAFDREDYLFASIGGSIFRSSQPSTSVRTSNNNLPALFQLEQNYPNPFNPNTTISFSIPRKSYVELKIYNTLGEEVATLLRHEQKDAGRHTVTWNGRNAAGQAVGSGLYFVRLRAKNFVQTRKMLLVE